MSTPDTPGLTQSDRRKLAAMAANGVHAYTNSSRDSPGTDRQAVECRNCGHEWRTISPFRRVTCSACGYKTPNPNVPERPDGRGLTPAMCAAIREAAHDGLTTGEITDLFSFVGGRQTVRRHAYGRCDHGGREPVEPRPRGPPDAVGAAECAALRERYAGGESVNRLADATGRAQSTVYQHVSGGCSHVVTGGD